MKIPSIIKEAFSFEIANFKGHIKRLGEKDGVECDLLPKKCTT